jgi:hypothetical protein
MQCFAIASWSAAVLCRFHAAKCEDLSEEEDEEEKDFSCQIEEDEEKEDEEDECAHAVLRW